MRIYQLAAATAALVLVSAPVRADAGLGFGTCKSGFADNTVVTTESRGEVSIGQLKVDDRVWSYNEVIGKPGWSRVLRRIDAGPSYRILADFSVPGSNEVSRACWIIRQAS